MDTFYLVDYENVGSSGVAKCSGLVKTDHLIIFYTDNSKKIDLDIVNNHGESSFETRKVPAKSQSVDMHIVSYMGYLIGKYEKKEIKIIIISKDKDYDNLIKFWEDKASLERKQKIEAETKKKEVSTKASATKKTKAEPKKATEKSNAKGTVKKPEKAKKSANATPNKQDATKKPAKPKTKNEGGKTTEKKVQKADIKNQLNHKTQIALAKNNYPQTSISGVAKIVGQRYAKPGFLENVYEDLKSKYPKKYEEIYKLIEPVLVEFK